MPLTTTQYCSFSGIQLQTTNHFLSASKKYQPAKHWVFDLPISEAFKLAKQAKSEEEKFLISLYPLVHLKLVTGTNENNYPIGKINKMFSLSYNILKTIETMTDKTLKKLTASTPKGTLNSVDVCFLLDRLAVNLEVDIMGLGLANDSTLRKLALETDLDISEVFNNSFYILKDIGTQKETFTDLYNQYPEAFPRHLNIYLYNFECEADSINIDLMNDLVKTCSELLDFTDTNDSRSLVFYRFLQNRQNLALTAQDAIYGGMLSKKEYKPANSIEGINVTIIDTTSFLDDKASLSAKSSIKKLESKTNTDITRTSITDKLKYLQELSARNKKN